MTTSRLRYRTRDAIRIHLDDEHQLRAWAAEFGVPPREVRAAVLTVGAQPRLVERYLRSAR